MIKYIVRIGQLDTIPLPPMDTLRYIVEHTPAFVTVRIATDEDKQVAKERQP